MHLHFEKSINAKCDCSILSMSWMGKVPDELPEEEGWKLNRTHYYQEGWLATGNLRGIVGVTFTSSHWRKSLSGSNGVNSGWLHDLPQRTNYNLRGHRSQITLVQWNEPYQKLASCDSSGIIFVWIKFEGRWSIELINDRSTPVTHFSWSHDGRMALICYRDGFVLVGSVAGQRYWSSMLNLNSVITCGLWSPSDQQVYLGTSNAQVIVMDVVHGMMLSQVQMPMDASIISMAWSCEKFKMEENDESVAEAQQQQQQPQSHSYANNSNGASTSADSHQQQSRQRPLSLAVAFQNGTIFLMRNYDDIAPVQIVTGMQQSLMMEWSNSGETLAVVGTRPVEVINESGVKVHEYFSSLHFYNHSGVRILNIVIPSTQWPVTALCWGHNDKRLFVATGHTIHVGWVAKRVASLQLLCRLTIYKAVSDETCVSHLPLPMPVRTLISSLHTKTIQSLLPSDKDLLEFVSHPPTNNTRLHCTMIRHDEAWTQSPGAVYTLYLEYLGGLIPILKGKRTSKIRPHFVVFSPLGQTDGASNPVHKSQTTADGQTKGNRWHPDSPFPRHADHNACPFHLLSDSSDSEDVELCASPRLQRRRHRARMRQRERDRQREREVEWERNRDHGQHQQGGQDVETPPTAASSNLQLNNLDTFGLVQPNQQLIYSDVLPESLRLVEVTSNIWGTRFKIHGLESFPPNLGSLSYKTSVLHLQPRQMTCIITELTDDIFVNSTTNSESQAPSGSRHLQQQAGTSSSVTAKQQQQLLDEVDDMFSIVVGSTNGACASNSAYYSGGALERNEHTNSSFRSRYVNACKTATKDDDSMYVEFVPIRQEPTHPDTARCTTPTSVRRQLVTHAALIERIDETTTAAISVASTSGVGGGPSSILSHRGSVHSSPTRRRISWTKLQHEIATGSTPSGSGESSRSAVLGTSTATAAEASSPPPVQPLHVRRSISASYLDNVLQRTLPAAVDMVAEDMINPQSPPKRLVLVKEQQVEEDEEDESTRKRRPINWLKDCGKSKSWDFADLSKGNQRRNAATAAANAAGQLRPCPNCKFPTTHSNSKPHAYAHEYAAAAPVLKPFPPLETPKLVKSADTPPAYPKTPARKLSTPRTPFISRRRDSNEDRIEQLADSPVHSSSTPTPPVSPRHALSSSLTNDNSLPPPTPKPQRRFSNFLTPILRRRDLFSCGGSSHNGSEKRKGVVGGNPNSTCFIPPDSPTHTPKPMSNPTTPSTARRLKAKHQSYLAAASSPIRNFFANSPLLSRRKCNTNLSSCTSHLYHRGHNRQFVDSTDEEDEDHDIEVCSSSPDRFGRPRPKSSPAAGTHFSRNSSANSTSGCGMVPPGTQAHHASTSTFRDLETFQKNQLRQKLGKKKVHNIDKSPIRPKRREFVLHNKAPMWNENSQVYQLDFGGRVTQESAKNFQIEFRGKQVMQFGRIDGNAYTLDFQYPFSALQAFGVALANVTQRLK